MKFKIPDGFEIPPETEEEGEFTVVGTFKDNGDGTLSLVAIDGSKLAGEKEKTKDPEPASLFGRAKAAGIPIKGE